MLDWLIKNGTVVDGTNRAPFVADVGLREGKIVAVGKIDAAAQHSIDATGLHVLPGFIDIHTHYDGQASWDETFVPSVYHGVTTLVMGNCGVGFAPVRPTDHAVLIDLMEGVEEIPGAALAEGLTWGWESFGQYMQLLASKPHTLDFMTLVPHDALRLYVMGERAARGEAATEQDLAHMQTLLRAALLEGAAGLSVGSTENHRTAKGVTTPSFEVASTELDALAAVFQDLPPACTHRVIHAVNDFAPQRGDAATQKERFDREYQKLERMARISGRTVAITWMDRVNSPLQAQWLSDAAKASAAKGLDIKLQTASRGIGILNGLDTTFNLLIAFPSYREIAHLPAPERAARLRDPALRQKILAESPIQLSTPGSTAPPLIDQIIANFEHIAFMLFPVQAGTYGMDYEPHPSTSFGAQAKQSSAGGETNVTAKALMYDHLVAGEGNNLVYFPIFNYLKGSLDTVREMLLHPQALSSLSDAGAHVGTICDASASTTLLAYWGGQRQAMGRGQGLPLQLAVHMLTQRNARHMGLADRGVIEIGKKADINLVNLGKLSLPLPQIVRDLPAGGRRMVQKASGYVATWVNGQQVTRDGALTPARPGRWVRPA